jgi:protocatechuate 3,4-dioxygenase beta subunit
MTDQTNAPTRRRLLSFAATLPASLGLTAGRASAQQAMIPTAPDMEGPFYISNTPVLRDLNRFGKKGEAMRITGRVMNAGSPDMPVAGAMLEIWQTDGQGRYYPQKNGDYADFRDEDMDLRGTVIADANGNFEVTSLVPKEYWPRPPHIHYRISATGFRTLITQHYLDTRPRERPHRTAMVIRDQTPWIFPAPVIYLEPA